MTDLRTAAQQALEALEGKRYTACGWRSDCDKAITALRAAMAEPESRPEEPMALDWLHKWANQDDGEPETQWHQGYEAARRVVQIHLTTPPQRKPLTEEEIFSLFRAAGSPVQEPVAWLDEEINCAYTPEELDGGTADGLVPLYTAPPQRKPLTEEEIDELSRTMVKGDRSVNWLCRAIERAHGIT